MIIIGLGNPGKKYENNRHNVGKMFIDYISQKSKVKSQKFNLKLKTFKTNCFMNESGKEVVKIIKNLKLKIKNLIIVHDDLDIPLGKFRIDFGKGPKLHNGLKSIEETLNTEDFWRIRIGVDNRQKTGWIDGEAYVLQDFLPEEREVLENEVFGKIGERLFKMVK
jgi:PTH1 family peptidyl-tRNA hydrolase